MTTRYTLPLKDLDEAFLKQLRAQHADAEVEIIINAGQSDASPMSEEQFWAIINRLDWSKTGDDEAMLEPAVAFLAAQDVKHIYQFEDKLSEKLYALDREDFARAAMGNQPYFSVDKFLYLRACVVANGEQVYNAILQNPEQMPEDITFEPLLWLAGMAYERKTGKEFNYVPPHNYETFGNVQGWSKKAS